MGHKNNHQLICICVSLAAHKLHQPRIRHSLPWAPTTAVTLWPAQTRRRAAVCRRRRHGRPAGVESRPDAHPHADRYAFTCQRKSNKSRNTVQNVKKNHTKNTKMIKMKDTFVCDRSIIFYPSRNPSGQQKKAFSIHIFFIFLSFPFFFLFQTFAYLISHPSPPFSTTSVLNKMPTTIWEMFFLVLSLFLYELYRDQCFF